MNRYYKPDSSLQLLTFSFNSSLSSSCLCKLQMSFTQLTLKKYTEDSIPCLNFQAWASFLALASFSALTVFFLSSIAALIGAAAGCRSM